MFGKKDKEPKPEKPIKEKPVKEKAAKAPKAPKAAKKGKVVTGQGGPNFLAAHVEKMVLAVSVGLVGYLLYAGFTAPGYQKDRVPEVLQRSATTAMTQISEDHWAEIAPTRVYKHDYKGLAEEARREADPGKYKIGSMDPGKDGPTDLRGDPKILPPEQIVGKVLIGPIAAEVPRETPDPYGEVANAGRILRKGEKEQKEKKSKDDDEEDKPKSTYTRRLSSKYDLGAPIGSSASGGEGGYGGGMDMGSGMGGMSGMSGMGGSGGGTKRQADGTLGDPLKDRKPKTALSSQTAVIVAATALVRHKEMVEEYDRLFENAGEYIVTRDRPFYLSYEVQRVDVTKDPSRQVAENEWKTITDGAKQYAFIRKNWYPPRNMLWRPVSEVADRNAVHPGLTMPIPPLLIRDYREACKHPKIAWIWDAKPLFTPRKQEEKKEDDTEILPGSAANSMAGSGGGGMMGGMMGGMEGSMGGGYGMDGGDGYGGMGGGYGMDGGDGYGGMGGGYGMDGGDGYGGMGGMGGYGMEGMGGMMGGSGDGYGGMGGATAGPPPGPQPEYKMLRFYDVLTTGDIGKKFRYRVRLVMRDPNYPERVINSKLNPNQLDIPAVPEPSPSSLKPEVFERIAALRKVDDAAFEKDKKKQRKLLESPWSEPSDPIAISGKVKAFTGLSYDKTAQQKGTSVSNDVASIVVSFLDTSVDKITNTPLGETFTKAFAATRGMVLNSTKKEEFEFVVPYTKIVKKREKPQGLATFATVIDMRGGEKLDASGPDDPLMTAGEVMVLLPDGTMQITNDLDNTFDVRMYTFADEHEQAEKRGAGGGSGGYGEGGMMGDTSGGDGYGGMGSEGGSAGPKGGGRGRGGKGK